MRCSPPIGLLLVLALASTPAQAASRWTADAGVGDAANLQLPVLVTQDRQPDLEFRGHWETPAFEGAPYFALRVGLADSSGAWALELVHHKIRLTNTTAEVQSFEVSHGYNLLVLERLRIRAWWHLGAGLGVVVAHPENRVRDLSLNESRGVFGLGYDLTGPAVVLLGGVRHPLGRGAHAFAELKISGASARLPVAQGWSSVPNVAAHVTIGLGWSAPAAAAH